MISRDNNNAEPIPAGEFDVPAALLDDRTVVWDGGPDPLHSFVGVGGGDSPALRADRARHQAIREWGARVGLTDYQARHIVKVEQVKQEALRHAAAMAALMQEGSQTDA